MFSENLHTAAGLPDDLIEKRVATMPGSERSAAVRCVASVSALFGALDALADASIHDAGKHGASSVE